uniref:Methylated-DNA--protein-cysteine methyltransferase n=1 Tax=Trepomonas sp. PC1 TaxID=1076344 RepID=A0A146KF57_9EUKA|eukprot:JAP95343.1 Methylated-DNA--protein-cysteine methyltransferase [Trepomonas sp. PC1]
MCKTQLEEYFNKQRKQFTVPSSIVGSHFMKGVLEHVKTVAYGKTSTYGQIAVHLNTKAFQAIGQALHKNPLPFLIPCHRVLGKNNIGGYAFGLEMKKKILQLETDGFSF